MNKQVAIGAGLLIAVAVLVWAFMPKATEVEVGHITVGRFERSVQDEGKLRVRARYVVSAPVTGTLQRISLKEGDVVTRGQVLAVLTPTTPALLDERARQAQSEHLGALQANVSRTEANIARAQAALAQAQSELQRSERLALALQVPAAALVRLWLQGAAGPARSPLVFEAPGNPQDRMMFLDNVTVPDHALVMPGERFTKTWALQNVGATAWPARRLVRCDEALVVARRERSGALAPMLDAYLSSLERMVEVAPTPPGAVAEISVDFGAPLENCTVASVWRLETGHGQPCYAERCFLQVIVTVHGD